MHITILSAGSRGDIQPFIVLGQTLRAQGHNVRIAAPLNYADSIRRHDLEAWVMRVDFQELLEGQSGQQLMASGQNMLQTMREGQRAMQDSLPLLVEDVWQASHETDCLISHVGLSAPAQTAAEAQQISLILGTLQPFAPTRAFMHPLWPARAYLGGSINRLTGALMNRMTWQVFQGEVNRLRRDTLTLPAQTYAGWQAAIQRVPMLNAYSPQLIDYPTDWPDNQHITGFWNADPDRDWQSPDDLRAFLAADDRPICVTFGSMAIPDRAAVEVMLHSAQQMTGQRAVWIGAWHDPGDERTFVIDTCPYEWLLPQVSAVIHHGGAGTFAAALSAGTPSIITPFLMDQFFWGELADQLGVGTPAIPFKRLTANALANAIHRAITDPTLRQRAATLSERIRQEDGTTQAAQIIEVTGG